MTLLLRFKQITNRSPVILLRRSVGVLVGVGIALGRQPVHLLVNLLAIDIHFSEILHAARLVGSLFEELSLASEGLLEFCGLWVETIVVVPLVFKVELFSETESKGTDERDGLENSYLLVKSKFFRIVYKEDLPDLESSGQEEQGANPGSILLEALILQDVLVLEGIFSRVVVAEILHVLN